MVRSQPARALQSPLARSLAVVLYALGLLASSVHFGVVPHQVCEHGEVAHVERAAPAGCEHDGEQAASHPAPTECGSAPSAPGGTDPSERPQDEQDDSEHPPAHEHCGLDASTTLAAPVELARPGLSAWLEEVFAPRSPAAPRAPAIAVLRRAPGRSPPRA